jgi:acetyl-CoA acyltransferase 1
MIVDPKTENEVEIVVDAGDGIQDGVTAVSLSKFKPSFSENINTRTGNASQVSDGAAAVLLARRSVAEKLGLPIVGKFFNSAVISVPPRITGVGPAFANPKVLNLVDITKDEVDFYEIDKAFASQAVFSIQHFKVPFEKVNINGGAIAIGHPLGCTGARQISTGLNVARQTGGRVFVTSMCMGSGMGMAALFVNEH